MPRKQPTARQAMKIYKATLKETVPSASENVRKISALLNSGRPYVFISVDRLKDSLAAAYKAGTEVTHQPFTKHPVGRKLLKDLGL